MRCYIASTFSSIWSTNPSRTAAAPCGRSSILFAVYCAALIWYGWNMGFTSFGQHEGSGTLWNPPIWPLKLAIPLGGLLLLVQGVANLLVDLGLANKVAEDE